MHLPSGTSEICPPAVFTSGEVQRLVGLTQRQLTYWDMSALLCPHGRAARGRGSRRLYTLVDVLQLKLIQRLREAGLSLQKIRQALTNLSDPAGERAPLVELEVLTDGQRILIRRSDEHILDPLARQFVLRFPLAALLAEIQEEVPAYPFNDHSQAAEEAAIGVQRR